MVVMVMYTRCMVVMVMYTRVCMVVMVMLLNKPHPLQLSLCSGGNTHDRDGAWLAEGL